MTAIEFENISKQYQLGKIGTGTLSKDLNRWWAHVRGKEDPYLKIGQVNDRTKHADSEFVWALRDINLKIEQGDVVGIIGKNGSGKSTLLKILSKITAPTTGVIRGRGRVASLLEVGTGFHPEMTGRENIYMNGAIMGMTKQEIDRKLDEIVDFAGVEMYLDTPVKRYSSGMTVRLGFAIAAHLEPEILVVDEVLAVGDAEFQKKAIGKMQDVSKGQGRTVLFVSHNMTAVKKLCNSGLVLCNGMIDYVGSSFDCVNHYQKTNINSLSAYADKNTLVHNKGVMREFEYQSVKLLNNPDCIATQEPLVFEFVIKKNTSIIHECQLGMIARNTADTICWTHYSSPVQIKDAETFRVRLTLPHHFTPMGRYYLNFNISRYDYAAKIRDYDIVMNAISFEVNHVDEQHKQPFTLWPFSSGTSIQESVIEML